MHIYIYIYILYIYYKKEGKKEQGDQLFYKRNNYYTIIKLAIEINPLSFLATRIDRKENGHYNKKVY